MTKIASLTPQQEADLSATCDKWLKIGRNTAPLDRSRAQSAITAMYAAIGKPAPMYMTFSSPAVAMIAISILRSLAKDQLGDQINDQLWGQIKDQLGGHIRSQIGSQIGEQIVDQLRSQLVDQLWYQLKDQLKEQIRDRIWGQLRNQLWGQLNDQIGDQLRGQLVDQLGENLGDQIEDQIGGQLRGQLVDQLVGHLNWDYFAGQHWCAWEVFFDFCNRIGVSYTSEQRATLDLWLEQSQACHWWWPMDGLCILTERNTVLTVDDRGRLHNEAGPAVMYSDGWALHAWHGLTIPQELDYIIHSPQQITTAAIEAQNNAELRRVMIDRYGPARYVTDSGAIVVQKTPDDHPMVGLRSAALLFKAVPDDEPIVYVDLLNSTPEPDGSVKRYMLRVSPHEYDGETTRNVHAAAASTWRNSDGSLVYKDWRDYQPIAES